MIMHTVTQRELDILQELAKGKTNQEIADTLFISRSTVKAHLEKLFFEFNVYNRVQLVMLALKEGLISVNIL